MVRGAAYYAGILESLYTALSALDTTDYRWGECDRWSQSPTPELTDHLQCWISLGTVSVFGRSKIEHESSIAWTCRYVPDDDSLSQARLHASLRDVMELLASWSHGGARAVPVSSALTEGPDLLQVTLRFTLVLPRSL